ncbi:MAG: hypothetical protein DMD63_16265, partial [Gemmatimonadetes bacterium]
LQREKELERRIYDGTITALFILEDVRVGDVIDFSYTIRGANPILGDRYAGYFWTAYSAPVKAVHMRMIHPPERKLNFRQVNSPGVSLRIKEDGPVREVAFDAADTMAIVDEGDRPHGTRSSQVSKCPNTRPGRRCLTGQASSSKFPPTCPRRFGQESTKSVFRTPPPASRCVQRCSWRRRRSGTSASSWASVRTGRRIRTTRSSVAMGTAKTRPCCSRRFFASLASKRCRRSCGHGAENFWRPSSRVRAPLIMSSRA